MNNDDILAGIVAYNPDIDRLRKNLDAISLQVSKVVVVDNGSSNSDDIGYLLKAYCNAHLIINNENRGIAAALNQIGDAAVEFEKDYFITLDQDSIADSTMVTELSAVFDDARIGMACPYVDRKGDFSPGNIKTEVKTAITSGCMVRTDVWKEIGGFWEYLFIDEVDHEFCYQMRRKGYLIVQTNSVAISHIIGEPFTKKFLGHEFNPTNHSAFRRYYIARNSVIMHHLFPEEKDPFPHRYRMLFRIIISTLCCESGKAKKIGAMLRGIKDAMIWNLHNNEIKVRRE